MARMGTRKVTHWVDDTPVFRFFIKTDNTSGGSTADTHFKFPTESSGTYDFHVDWGDGKGDRITAYDQAEVDHTYSAIGTYQIKVTGPTFDGWFFNNGLDKQKMLDIVDWGFGVFVPGGNGKAFYGCLNMNYIGTKPIDLTGTTTIQNFFQACDAFNGDITRWDTSSITNFGSLFNSCNIFNGKIGVWDTSSVTKMNGMFTGCDAFNQDLSGWDVSNVTTFSGFMNGSELFTSDLSSWDVSKATTFANMFKVNEFFDSDISGWTTTAAISFVEMFRGAEAFDQDIGSWDLNGVNNVTNMFNGATLAQSNYNALLIGWEPQTLTASLAMHGGSSTYDAAPSTAATAKANIIANDSWTFTDGGEA